jgi:Tfp pilus assembly PilM family ATPase
VSQVFFAGGSAKADAIISALQSELMVPCKNWNPTTAFTLQLDPQRMTEVEHSAPQLAAAIGAAVSTF